MTPAQFSEQLAQHGFELSPEQQWQFEQYFKLLVKTNQNVNLTAITEQGAVYLKHFYDSLLPAIANRELFAGKKTVCDVGAGAGFPSLPIKILFPELKVTIVDSLNKRIVFLQELVKTLGLTDVTCVHARAEVFGSKTAPTRENFDIVTARAVAALNVLAEFCVPLVKVGGKFVALKAAKADEELTTAQNALATLGAEVAKVDEQTLPEVGETRKIIVMDKVAKTPQKYPRKPGMPLKRPLV